MCAGVCGRSTRSLCIQSGCLTPLRDVETNASFVSSFLRAGYGPRSVLVAPILERCRRGVGSERVRDVAPQGRSRSQRLLDPAALACSRSCSYRDEMSSGLMMSQWTPALASQQVRDLSARGRSRLERVAHLAPVEGEDLKQYNQELSYLSILVVSREQCLAAFLLSPTVLKMKILLICTGIAMGVPPNCFIQQLCANPNVKFSFDYQPLLTIDIPSSKNLSGVG
ncbi:hypothetical protein DY000_02053605 [Brassica cretica]|uniref:Uncharacterized protein n=1 Tax=Brassica cretica TaxID=69181 RepID=A0ABQ7A4I1_BRACR|nr:hypothetical protein DY000_02053605 [Brassica cretica]